VAVALNAKLAEKPHSGFLSADAAARRRKGIRSASSLYSGTLFCPLKRWDEHGAAVEPRGTPWEPFAVARSVQLRAILRRRSCRPRRGGQESLHRPHCGPLLRGGGCGQLLRRVALADRKRPPCVRGPSELPDGGCGRLSTASERATRWLLSSFRGAGLPTKGGPQRRGLARGPSSLLVGMQRCRDARIRLRNDVAVVFVPAVALPRKRPPGDARGPRLHLQCENLRSFASLAVERGGCGIRSGVAGFVAPRLGPRRGS